VKKPKSATQHKSNFLRRRRVARAKVGERRAPNGAAAPRQRRV
jgi:hypothetical protein